MNTINEPAAQQSQFIPSEFSEIADLETLKVIADPLRLRIRELMSEPCTVKQIAAELGMPATKLYYHVNLLEKHGLIVMVDTRIVSGIIEKQYQAAARELRVSGNLLSSSSEATDAGLDFALNTLVEDVKNDLRESLRAGCIDLDEKEGEHHGLALASHGLFLTEAQAADFYRRLREIMNDFMELSRRQRQERNAAAERYRALLVTFPSTRRDRPSDK